jgi:hypothetical protein
MFPNDPFDCFDLDSIRLVAIQSWASTVQRTYHIDADILELARGEACRRYQDLEGRLKGTVSPSLEDVREAIDAWVTWQALDLQAFRQDDRIGPDGIYDFIQDLELTLHRLTTHTVEDMFIL